MVIVPARQATLAGGIHYMESIHGLQKSLKIPAQLTNNVGRGGGVCVRVRTTEYTECQAFSSVVGIGCPRPLTT